MSIAVDRLPKSRPAASTTLSDPPDLLFAAASPQISSGHRGERADRDLVWRRTDIVVLEGRRTDDPLRGLRSLGE
jgi:hypothetical protein